MHRACRARRPVRRSRTVRAIWRAALMVGLAGCRVTPTPDLNVSLAQYNSFVRRQLGDSIAALYAPEGELITPNGPIRGPAAIRDFLATFKNVRVDSMAMWADSVATTDSGVVQWGHWYQRATVPGRPVFNGTGRFVALWQEQHDGRWLLRRMNAR